MIIKLKNGVEKEYGPGITAHEIARDLSEGLARVACAAKADTVLIDLRQPLNEDCSLEILTFDDPDGRKAFRHTASHILAQAVKRLYPGTRLAIGPSTDDGFYYDFDRDSAFSAEEISSIEAEMKRIIKEDPPIECFSLPRKEALELMADEPYKVELINDLPEGVQISFYKQGDFTDLCAGPHLMNMKLLKAVKLTSDSGSSGAYWRGSEKNKMLSRIYGTAFTKASELEEYLKQREEAKKRDHNKLGRELGIFTTSEMIGQGLPLLMPKGAKIFQILSRFVEDEEERRGYVLTKTPYMAKSDLYKTSGHWDHYKDGMFIMGEEDDPYALRPMTCPFQFTIYNTKQHSYRDLPIRYNETSTLFRNESSGEMHGLIRVRQFTLSEGHLVCTHEQLGDEFKGVVDLANFMMKTFGIDDDITYRFSMWDPGNKDKYIGDAEQWEEAQAVMDKLLHELGIDFVKAPGEAAFYGPKLDLQFRNVHGKEDTAITVQVDFALAERFNMTYIDKDGSKKYPIIIHRTSVGCYERTIAMLIEKYAGAFPTWLSPTQAIVLPISDKYNKYAEEVAARLKSNKIRTEVDSRAEKIGFKIRAARNERIPYLLVAGEKEAAAGTVSLRSRTGDEGEASVQQVIERIVFEDETRLNNGGV